MTTGLLDGRRRTPGLPSPKTFSGVRFAPDPRDGFRQALVCGRPQPGSRTRTVLPEASDLD